MTLQGLTAQYPASSSHEIKPGPSALVRAGTAGVGLLLTQSVKHLGANVNSTVSPDEKAELPPKAVADGVFLYGEGVDITAKGSGDGLDVAYDGVGKDAFDASLAPIKPLGSMVLFGGASGQVTPFDIQRLNSSGGIFLSRPSLAWFVRISEEMAKRSAMLFNGIEHGWLNFRIGATFALSDAVEAHRTLYSRGPEDHRQGCADCLIQT